MKLSFFVGIALLSATQAHAATQIYSQDGSKVYIERGNVYYDDVYSSGAFSSRLYLTLTADRCAAAKSVEATYVTGSNYSIAISLTKLKEDPCTYSFARTEVFGNGNFKHEVAFRIIYWNNSEWLMNRNTGNHNFGF